MLWFLRLLFLVVLGSMLWVTSWASLQQSIFAIPREVVTNPWFIATLFDAYWGFVTFYVWQAWKEQSLAARGLWFVAVMLLGNLAMSIYLLAELFRIRDAAQLPRSSPAAIPAGSRCRPRSWLRRSGSTCSPESENREC